MFLHRTVYAALLASCFLVVPIRPASAGCDPDCDCVPCRWILNCAVIGSGPTILTVQWDWATPAPDGVIIAVKPTGSSGDYTDWKEVQYNQQPTCQTPVEGLAENTAYSLRLTPLTGGEFGTPCFTAGQTQLNYDLRPSAHVDQPTWNPFLASGIDEANLDLNDFIQADRDEGNNSWIWFDFADPLANQTWEIKRIAVHVVCQRRNTIDDPGVNIDINNQAATEQFIPQSQIPTPLMNPNWKAFQITFTNSTGKWTRNDLTTLKVGFHAAALENSQAFLKIFQAYVKTYDD